MIDRGSVIRSIAAVTNSGNVSANVRFIPTCDCLVVEPAERRILPGGVGSFELTYDTADDEGKVAKGYIIETDPPSPKPIYFLVSGVVRASNVAGGGSWVRRSPGTSGLGGDRPTFSIVYFYVPGCRSCDAYLAEELPRLETELGVWIEVARRDALDPEAYRELSEFAAARGNPLRAMPALRAGETLLQGDDEIMAEFPALLRSEALAGDEAARSGSASDAAAAPRSDAAVGGLGLLAVAAAGLVDGVNPCAFTTLIFLMASLALAGRGRKEILAIGACYSLAVFATYTAVGLGLFAALRAAAAAPAIGRALRWVLALALAALAALSLRDYFLARRGRPGDMLLQLPGFLKLKIHDAIRTHARAGPRVRAGSRANGNADSLSNTRAGALLRSLALAGGSLILGFLVSIFEFACSGQVYLPTLAYMARTGRGVGLLLAYNAFFILPLLAVFAASYAGVGSARIAAAFKSKIGAIKLALAAVFALLAAITAFVL
ncbi:MAG: hypothetical protein Q8M76_15500 [Spirochaetaceae bacterium]|nr:hypothetical protein [Spirochaetaceae bacterium]